MEDERRQREMRRVLRLFTMGPISTLAPMLLCEKWHWHDVALSEHGFNAPKRITIRKG